MSPHPAEVEVKKRMFRAAKQLFFQQGFADTSVRQICEKADVDIALASYYFRDKRELFFSMVESFFPYPYSEPVAYTYRDPAAQLENIIHAIVQFSIDEPELNHLLLNEMSKITGRTPRLQSILFPVFSAVKNLLDKGRREGVFSFASTDEAMLFVLGAMWFSQPIPFLQPLLERFETDSNVPTASANQTWQFVMSGLGTKST